MPPASSLPHGKPRPTPAAIAQSEAVFGVDRDHDLRTAAVVQPPPEVGPLTQRLLNWTKGDQRAQAEVYQLTYTHLLQVARAHLQGERRDHTLNASALVHEAYLRLASSDPIHWVDRRHFFCVVSSIMRRVLVDHARARCRSKRSANDGLQTFNESLIAACTGDERLLALDQALHALHEQSPEHARCVLFNYFGGLTQLEIAALEGVSLATIERRLMFARTWLRRHMCQSPNAMS